MSIPKATFFVGSSACALLAGTAASVVRAARDLTLPQIALVHTRQRQHVRDASRPIVSTFLFSQTDLPLPVPGDDPAVALAVPRERVGLHVLPTLVHLPMTPLVRASRSMLRSLQRDLAAQRDHLEHVEDVALSLIRAVVLQHASRSDEVDDSSLTAQLEAFIDAHHRDPLLDVDGIAQRLHFSRRQLYRFARGDGVAAMLAERRLATACDLLREQSDLSITEVALMSGFTSASRLRVHVMRRFGVTPTEYRDGAECAARDSDLSRA
ncbi:helix-turn-helix domain-containing protein [Microbacterium sp. NPDC055357]